jgi:hypothetical protein
MSRPFSLSMLMAVAGVSLTAPIAAQTRSAVSVAELDAAVAERPAAAREAVLEFLTTPIGWASTFRTCRPESRAWIRRLWPGSPIKPA